MGKFKMEDYDPVEVRIKKFYSDHPDGGITTKLLSSPDNLDHVVVQADIHVAGVLRASGLAQETRDKELSKSRTGYEFESVNYTSWLENAETSAIGRALANFNYAGNKRPSREEMEKVERMETSKAVNPIHPHTEAVKPPLPEQTQVFENIRILVNEKLPSQHKVPIMTKAREAEDAGDYNALLAIYEEAKNLGDDFI